MKLTPRRSTHSLFFASEPKRDPARPRDLHYGGVVPLGLSRNDSLSAHWIERRAQQAARHYPRSRSKQRGFIINHYSGNQNDPNFADVAILLPCDGVDGGTSLVDVSSHAQTMTRVSPAVTTTTQIKFGTSSTSGGGSGGAWTAADQTWFTVSTLKFCFEGWAYPSSLPASTQFMAAQCASSGANTTFSIGVGVKNVGGVRKLYALACSGSTAYEITGTTTLNAAAWGHFAFERVGDTATLYWDGASEGTVSLATAVSINNSSDVWGFLRAGALTSLQFGGLLDEIRYTTNDISRYGAPFTPPSAIFPRQ